MEQYGSGKARSMLWKQLLRSYFTSAIFNFRCNSNMFNNYVKIAIRNIQRYRGYSLINICGLSIGIASCLLIYLWVNDEIHFDEFHENKDTLYRVVQERYPVTPSALVPALKEELPEVVRSSRYRPIGGRLLKYGDKAMKVQRFSLVDQDYFDMFSFPFVKGDPETAFKSSFSIVITEETAQKFFGDENPLGKTVKVENRFNFKVTGIIKNTPDNSHMQFDVLAEFKFLRNLWGENLNSWGSSSHLSYVQLEDNTLPETVAMKATEMIIEHSNDDRYKLKLIPVTGIHLSTMPQWVDGEQGSRNYVYIFSAAAFVILVIACINFMNLATAISIKRSKEVGVRKVIGAKKSDLIIQHFGESLILSFISLLFAIVIALAFLPVFNNLTGKAYTPEFFFDMNILTGMILLVLFTGLLAGSYPALFVSSFKVASVLKASLPTAIKGNSSVRKALIIVQYALMVFLIISTTTIYKQLTFINNQDLGYYRENIITFPVTNSLLRQLRPIGQDMMKNPDILSATISSALPGKYETTTSGVSWPGKDPEATVRFEVLFVDLDFLDTFGLEIIDGRFFLKEYRSELANGVILNEAAVNAIGITKGSPLGHVLTNVPTIGPEGDGPTTVLGVIKDFHSRSLHHDISPLIIRYSVIPRDNLSIRIKAGKVPETLEFLNSLWENYAPDHTFEYMFFDEILDDLYTAEQRMGKVFNYFTILAVFISSLGLIGLAAFMGEQKSKEVGIRKVLGADTSGIVILMSKGFLSLVVISVAIAIPASYYASGRWLEKFAYRTEIGLWIFFAAGLFTILIAFLTISYQSIKSAQADPVKSLRYE